jgi:hypothetical protein
LNFSYQSLAANEEPPHFLWPGIAEDLKLNHVEDTYHNDKVTILFEGISEMFWWVQFFSKEELLT